MTKELEQKNLNKEETKEVGYALLEREGVSVNSLVELVRIHQGKHFPDISDSEAIAALDDVMNKRNTLYALQVALYMDESFKNPEISKYYELSEALADDEPLFSIDEYLAFYITRMYGDIASTGYAHMDITKPGVVGDLNDRDNTVFIDDIVSAIATSAGARIASLRNADEMIGKRFGELTVIKKVESDKGKVYQTRCDCGSYRIVKGTKLCALETKTCGHRNIR